jgi:hypothetical protein
MSDDVCLRQLTFELPATWSNRDHFNEADFSYEMDLLN